MQEALPDTPTLNQEADAASPTERASLAGVLSQKRLPALDGLRAIAVFTVIIYHFGFESVPGDLGVTAFFVLSGFLITWLLLKEHDRTGHISVPQFYLRRALRIAPAYYGFLFLIYVEEHLRGYPWDTSLTLSGLFYVVNYYNAFNGHPDTAIAHAWSLGVEQQFYLLWPLVLLLVLHRGTKTIAFLTGTIVCLVLVWRSFAYLYFDARPAYVYNAFETRLDSIAIGCLFAVCLSWKGFQSATLALSRNILSPILVLALLMYSRIGGSHAYHYSIGFTIDSMLLAIFMIQLLTMSKLTLWSWIDHPIMVYLGHISYSIYLYHLVALGIGHRLLPEHLSVRFAISVMLCIIIASLSYWLVERPFLNIKQRFA
jgi:peptidoglycan/LPS O-acetylase OafA/YrhL